MSCKNKRFIKRGLTPEESKRMEVITKADKDRWKELLDKPLNKWRLVK